jgi:hypothetical protein
LLAYKDHWGITQSCLSLQALYLCKRLKSSPKTRDHVRNDHVTIFYVDIQKLAFDRPSTRCSCHNLEWPVGHNGRSFRSSSCRNHTGATDFPEQITNYLIKEASYQAVVGPFKDNPSLSPLYAIADVVRMYTCRRQILTPWLRLYQCKRYLSTCNLRVGLSPGSTTSCL